MYEVIAEGIKQFGGKIIGGILVLVAWWLFPWLRTILWPKPPNDNEEKLKSELKRKEEDLQEAKNQNADIEKQLNAQRQKEALRGAEAHKLEKARRIAEVKIQFETLQMEAKLQSDNENLLSKLRKMFFEPIDTRDAEAQYKLGHECYYNKDYEQAVKWWRKAAEQGHVKAQLIIGFMYENGYGVMRDYSEAVKWYRMAAEHGNAYAQFNLGDMYYNGEGVTRDKTEAVKWYRKSAEQGYAPAQYNLALIYYNGQGIMQDKLEAVKWYRKAAEQGHAPAQYNLGYMYKHGEGVAKDLHEARKWYEKAAAQGNEIAKSALERLK